MKKTMLIFFAGLILFAGCSKQSSTDPIQSLEKATISPERALMFEATKQVWESNQVPLETMSDQTISTEGNPPVLVSEQIPKNEPIDFESGVLPETYILQFGETPKCIARRYNLNWAALYSLNQITFENENNISYGTVLKIPKNTEWNAAQGPRSTSVHPTMYTVQQGDTFNSIACIFGDVTPEAIAKKNSLNLNEAILPGLNLQIP
ncbi:MAG: LysM peptidoglycan-binding domain-containing protein [Flexilinea flocculi]|jgi:nucleoid-associated protein YgaU|nr:LysM peptidoglycan-binding domain-containing protein [Flexilinea flocculi]